MLKTLTICSLIPFLASVSVSAPALGHDWPMFGQSLDNTADNSDEHDLGLDNVARLAPKWVVTTGGDVSARAAVANHVAYFPDWAGNLWAVDTKTGKALWHRLLSHYGLPDGTVSRTTPAVHGNTLYLGTQQGAMMLAIDTRGGALLWKRQVDDHPQAVITASPALSHDMIFTGVSSSEEGAAADPTYKCCSFRGSAVALDAKTGKVLWKTFMTPEGYNGTAVWGSNPVVDENRKMIFYGTGNNYSKPTSPAYQTCLAAPGGSDATCHAPNDHFDSIVALDMDNGRFVWSRRLGTSDDWNVACLFVDDGVGNCPNPSGPDYDFSSAPNEFTVTLANGQKKTILGAGQKSGVYSAFDPDTGRMLWARQVGPGATLGGIEWGSATDGKRIYVAISNSDNKAYSGGTAGSWSALDPATGALLWQTPDPNGAIDLGPVAVANGVVYAPSLASDPKAPTMFALNAATGKVLWSFAAGGSVAAGAAIADHMVVWGSGYSHLGSIGSGNNKFYGFSIDGR